MDFSESASNALVQSALQGSSPYILSLDTELEALLQTLDDVQALAAALKSATDKASQESKYKNLVKSIAAISLCSSWLDSAEAEMEAAEQGMKSERNRFDSTLDSMPSHIKHSFREQTKVDRQAAKAAAAASPTSAAASAPQGSAAKIKDPSTSSVMSWFGRLRGASESSSATVVSHKDDRSGGQADANAANPIPDKNGPKGAAAAPSAEAKLIDSKSASENVETGDNGAARLASVAGKLFSGWGRRLSSELAYGGAVKPPSSDQGKGVP